MKERKLPRRTCVGCREEKDKKDLIRIVHTLEGDVRLDPTGRLAGRGAYLCRKAECLQRAIKQKQIERAFGCPVSEETKQALAAGIGEGSGDA